MRTREDVLREYMTPIPLFYVALGDGPLVPKDNIDVNGMADALIEARKDAKKMHELLAVAFFEGWDCGNAELASAVAALTQGDA
jgi:hypothetical protein